MNIPGSFLTTVTKRNGSINSTIPSEANKLKENNWWPFNTQITIFETSRRSVSNKEVPIITPI